MIHPSTLEFLAEDVQPQQSLLVLLTVPIVVLPFLGWFLYSARRIKLHRAQMESKYPGVAIYTAQRGVETRRALRAIIGRSVPRSNYYTVVLDRDAIHVFSVPFLTGEVSIPKSQVAEVHTGMAYGALTRFPSIILRVRRASGMLDVPLRINGNSWGHTIAGSTAFAEQVAIDISRSLPTM